MISLRILIKINSYVVENDNFLIDTERQISNRKAHVKLGSCDDLHVSRRNSWLYRPLF